jgi:hypothetical protein
MESLPRLKKAGEAHPKRRLPVTGDGVFGKVERWRRNYHALGTEPSRDEGLPGYVRHDADQIGLPVFANDSVAMAGVETRPDAEACTLALLLLAELIHVRRDNVEYGPAAQPPGNAKALQALSHHPLEDARSGEASRHVLIVVRVPEVSLPVAQPPQERHLADPSGR